MDQVVPISLEFRHKVTYIAKRGRRAWIETFRANDVAAIRKIPRSEALPAFRIHLPQHLRKHRQRRSIEIMAACGKLWWPLQIDHDRWLDRGASETEALRELATDRLGILDDDRDRTDEIPRTVDEVWFRECMDNQREAVLAVRKRKVLDHLLLCDGKAYALGGEPAYLQFTKRTWPSGVWESSVGSLGADRSFDPRPLGLCEPPGRFLHIINALWRGRFQRADQHALAVSRRGQVESPADVPLIEVITPEMMTARRIEVRLDAMFRRAYSDLFSEGFWHPPDALDDLRQLRQFLRDAASRHADDLDLSAVRCAALHEIDLFTRRHYHFPGQLEELLKAFKAIAGRFPSPGLLTPEEEKAIEGV